MKVYQTVVQSIGSQAHLFEQEGLLILFGENVPSELAEYCYLIQINKVSDSIKVGQSLIFDEVNYDITAVGTVVTKNLSELGHITIKFDGSKEADLPGTLHVSPSVVPLINKGTNILIE